MRKENISSRNRFVDPYHQQQGADKILRIITIRTQTARPAHQISIFWERVLWIRRKRGPEPKPLRWLGLLTWEISRQCLTSVLVCSVRSVTLSTFPQTLGQSRSALKSKRIMPLTLCEHSTNHEPMFSRTRRHQLLQLNKTWKWYVICRQFALGREHLQEYWRCASAVQCNFNWSCPTPAKAIQELHVLST